MLLKYPILFKSTAEKSDTYQSTVAHVFTVCIYSISHKLRQARKTQLIDFHKPYQLNTIYIDYSIHMFSLLVCFLYARSSYWFSVLHHN